MSAPVAVGTVLVVDDNAENRALAKATLEDAGVRVVLAANGDEGLQAFGDARPDCVLLDIKMPGISGIEVCERIRAHPDGARVSILFVTAQRDVATFDRALLAGGDDFVTKPFRPAELVVRIQTALRLRRLTASQDELSLQLKRQRDELQRLQLHKEQLSAFLVHDLKNPVNAIDLCAQRIVRHPSTDERMRDAAMRIQDETHGLSRMILNLLDIWKANEGLLAAARSSTDISQLVRSAIDEMRLRAQTAAVELEQDIEAGTIVVDRELVHRVLVNLIDNALRYAPERSTVRVIARKLPGETELRVVDSGAGVLPEQREAVFDRFVTTGARASRGLGLAFCKVVVEAHGGTIWVEDANPGQAGAAFCLRIPNPPLPAH